MRGQKPSEGYIFSYISPEQRVPKNHPIRSIRKIANEALEQLSSVFDEMYSHTGRPSVPPEVLLKSQLLMALYSIRSDRNFCETLDFNMLFRWFLDMEMDAESFDASVFSKNRERLMEHKVAHRFLRKVVTIARGKGLVSDEHFSSDGTLMEAWASMKSFKRKDGTEVRLDDDDPGNPTIDFHGEKRSNKTHESTTDPDARLMKKSKGSSAKLAYCGTVLMENRNGLCVDVRVTSATGKSEIESSKEMILVERKRSGGRMASLGGDKWFGTKDFVGWLKKCDIRAHVAKKDKIRISGYDNRTFKSPAYMVSQRKRKRIEEIFGWCKTIGGMRKTRLKGIRKNEEQASMIVTAYNLLRMSRLCPEPG